MGAKKIQAQPGERLYVIYDGNCNLCLASVARLKDLPADCELLFIPIQQIENAGKERRLAPGIEKLATEALYEKIHVADESGRLFAGADGIVRILRTVKGLKWISACYRIPGMKRLADRLYRYVAVRRYDWFGSAEESCSVHGCELPERQEGENKHD
ncbi:thiol-disulfide oxidoreductase DCC family protein [Paenibacillus harenae]|uniref:thiol-disulfide oxidoreductase DCC family protein n=1 Tax=Paenibacillus harenae TaxID=306543 RepID=UPI0004220272|nr:DUF393 domain-containing protein [Paenibacillus harenae]